MFSRAECDRTEIPILSGLASGKCGAVEGHLKHICAAVIRNSPHNVQSCRCTGENHMSTPLQTKGKEEVRSILPVKDTLTQGSERTSLWDRGVVQLSFVLATGLHCKKVIGNLLLELRTENSIV